MFNKIKPLLNNEGKHIFDQIVDHTIILSGFTYLITDEEEERGE